MRDVTTSAEPAIVPIADHAVLVEFSTEYSEATNARVVALDRRLAEQPIPGVIEVVPAFVNLLIDFDPLVTDHASVDAAVRGLLSEAVDVPATTHRHVVHVCYDDDFAPDLAAVAAASGLSIDGAIDAHVAAEYHVVMYGFLPGCAYLAGVDERIQVPRKQTPVRGVPAGSVIIAGSQCLITTMEMPSGWSIVGRSATAILRPEADRPFLFDPGDRVAFERVDRAEFERLVQQQ